MEVSVLGFPRKDLGGDPGSSKDSQKEGDKHKALAEGQCILKLGEQAGPEGHLHGVRVKGVFSFHVCLGYGSWPGVGSSPF